MSNDTAITRLLYAILSQKCLKDIDWNKVARDPVLAQEITNGHAARMRYSRFKKQMEGTAGVRKPRNPASPRKPKADKKNTPKKSNDSKDDDAEHVKPEGSSQQSQTSDGSLAELSSAGSRLGIPPAPVQHMSQHDSSIPHYGSPMQASPSVKKEPGLAQYPMTPGSQRQSPSPDFHGTGNLDTMNDMMSLSFDMPYDEHADSYSMMMADPFQDLWPQQQQHSSQVGANGEVLVKREERWDDAYDSAHA